MKSGASGRAIYLNHPAVDNDKNHDRQNLHGDADEEGLQKQAKQWPHIHLHEAGFQPGQTHLVDSGVACDDIAGFSDDFLCQFKDAHDDIEGVGDQVDGAAGLDDPLGNQGGLEAGEIVVLGDHLHQLITGHQGQKNTCNGQNGRVRHRLNHGKDPGLETLRAGPDLCGDISDLGIYGVKQAGEVGHNCTGQNSFDPVCNRVEYGFQRVSPPLSEEMVDKTLEQVENKNDVGENFHNKSPLF